MHSLSTQMVAQRHTSSAQELLMLETPEEHGDHSRGFSTWERVPPGQTYTDLNSKGEPYGNNYLMAKTYWNQPGGKTSAPPGSMHHRADVWLRRAIRSGGRFIPQKTLSVTDPMRQIPAINKFLDSKGAIDRNASVLRKTSGGRRILFGIDDKS